MLHSFIQSSPASRFRMHAEESIAVCTAVAWGYSEETNKDQSAQAAADAHAFICGGGGDAEAHAIATASARAFARAVAQASVSGYVEGDASCWLHAHASAQTEANLWLDSYAEAFATSADCKHCDAYAGAWAYVREEVFLSAQASAKASVRIRVRPVLLPTVSWSKILHLTKGGGSTSACLYGQEVPGTLVTAAFAARRRANALLPAFCDLLILVHQDV